MGKETYVEGDILEFTGGNNITYSREGIENSASRVMQMGKADGVTHDDPTTYETIETLKGVKVTAILFFDGTKNNRNNTFRRLDKDADSNTSTDSKAIYKRTYEKESSYENGYSNIAALSYMSMGDKANKIVVDYIEGEGTEDDIKGDTLGFAFGSGTTGIPAKANKGYSKINAKIEKVYDKDREYIKELIINVLGFSRGAAAARSFTTTTQAMFKTKYPKAEITYKFVGLFDTVSSYEPEGVFGKYGSAAKHNFDNDVKELGLQLGDIAKKVIHLTAGNEYRENFSLTTIASSIAAGVGFELQLPGAHSDIGGGYEEYEHIEKRVIDEHYKSAYEWINEGWYTENQIEESGTIDCNGIRKLKNSYQFIPLAIMMHFAKKSDMKFEGLDDDKQNKDFKVIPELENAKNKLLNLAIAKEGEGRVVAILNNVQELKMIRNRYLHISSNEKSLGMGANKPSFWSTEIKRNIIQDNA